MLALFLLSFQFTFLLWQLLPLPFYL